MKIENLTEGLKPIKKDNLPEYLYGDYSEAFERLKAGEIFYKGFSSITNE